MPLLRHNIAANDSRVEAAVLDWDEQLPDWVGAFDMIIMADVSYNTASFPSLVRTVKGLVNLNEKKPRVVVGYKERDMSERELWAMLDTAGIKLTLVGRRRGSGGMAVEIWDTS
ncbi:hypothetical protein B0H11DRAFT_2119071 [Mycena galericulata]|nr:hypothetical protein B0H11DRAFT_2119071 [Mycena galericulata]